MKGREKHLEHILKIGSMRTRYKEHIGKLTNPSLQFKIGRKAVNVCIPKPTYISYKVFQPLTAKGGTQLHCY